MGKRAPRKQSLCKLRAQEGLCSRCGKFPPVEKYLLCTGCLTFHRQSQQQRNRQGHERRIQQQTPALYEPVAREVIYQPSFADMAIGDEVAVQWRTHRTAGHRDAGNIENGQGAGGIIEQKTMKFLVLRDSRGYRFTVSLADVACGVIVQKK